jgi:hypothetical protein
MLILLATATAVAGLSVTAQAQRNPPGVNPTHYQCYRVAEKDPPFKPREVRLRDQFGASGAKVLKPMFLCAPTMKNNLKPSDTRTHYVCYEDEGPKAPDRPVGITNQFGKEILVVGGPVILCVPSTKTLIKQ